MKVFLKQVHADCLTCDIKNIICENDIHIKYCLEIIIYSILSIYLIYKIYKEFFPSPSRNKTWTILYIILLVKSCLHPIAYYIWEYVKSKSSYSTILNFLINNKKYISTLNILKASNSLMLDGLKIFPLQFNFIIFVCLDWSIRY